MALKGGFMKKMGNVITNATSDLLGEDAAERLVEIKNSVQETADNIGVTDGIKRVTEAGSSKIQQGKEKLAEWSEGETADSSKTEASIQQSANQSFDNIPNAVIMPVSNARDSSSVRQESAFEKYSNQAEQLWKLKELLDLGILSPTEFEQKKKTILWR